MACCPAGANQWSRGTRTLVHLAVTLFPLLELARAQLRPAEQPLGWQSAAPGPAVDEVDDLIARAGDNVNPPPSEPHGKPRVIARRLRYRVFAWRRTIARRI